MDNPNIPESGPPTLGGPTGDSGVGVLDKTMALLGAVEAGPLSLGELVAATGIPRPTAHRLAVALESHAMLRRDQDGRFDLGPRVADLALARGSDGLVALARPILLDLRDETGESAQLYRRRGDSRICVAGADRREGLRDTVPVGAVLTMSAGSAAQVLLAWEPARPGGFPEPTLAAVRDQGYAHSIAEREAGVGSVSAPVRGPGGRVLAALSVSGPVERLGARAGARIGPIVRDAADRLSAELR